MNIVIDWLAFLQVFLAALIGAAAIVTFYARAPVVSPAEFTDAITVITEKELRRAEKQAAKAAKKSPLTEGQKTTALVGAYTCFALCAAAVVAGILMLVIGH
jgi:hypothetical protein